jgi:hypothetical protein
LQKAARANDLRSFVVATEVVDWSACEPKDFILAVGFRGRWIAVKDGELLGSADLLADLVREVGKTPKGLFSLID